MQLPAAWHAQLPMARRSLPGRLPLPGCLCQAAIARLPLGRCAAPACCLANVTGKEVGCTDKAMEGLSQWNKGDVESKELQNSLQRGFGFGAWGGLPGWPAEFVEKFRSSFARGICAGQTVHRGIRGLIQGWNSVQNRVHLAGEAMLHTYSAQGLCGEAFTLPAYTLMRSQHCPWQCSGSQKMHHPRTGCGL